jgi:DNA-binding transcriptional LysR family regulator
VELRHLRYFLAVAEEKHFGRAAKRLGIAQPPLSRQIQALEGELGFELLDRSRRRVEVTAAGAVLSRHAQQVLTAIDAGVREARRAALGETGRLAIGYSASVALTGFTELLREFRTRSPGVDLVLRELPAQAQIEALVGGTIDVGFIRGSVTDSSLASRRVRREPLVVALPVAHPLAGKQRISLSQVAHEPFVCFPRALGPAFFDLLMRLCHEAGFTPHIAQEATQLDIVSLVAAGFGVALVPASIRAARRPGVAFVSIAGRPCVDLFVAWRGTDFTMPVKHFLEVVQRLGVGEHPREDTG